LVVSDDEGRADSKELALPALIGDGNHWHTGLHPDGGILKDDGVVRRGTEQGESSEVGVRERLGAVAVLAGDDELEEVGQAEDADHELGVGDGGALEPAVQRQRPAICSSPSRAYLAKSASLSLKKASWSQSGNRKRPICSLLRPSMCATPNSRVMGTPPL
jgi:hypothetical protein